MKICVIGIGYVGLSAALCFAKVGHEVFCVDKDKSKLDKLKSGILPIYEPKMEEIIKNNSSNLFFTKDIKKALSETKVCFIAVGTPTKENGEVDTSATFEVIDEIIKYAPNEAIIVNKSTVPIGFNEKLRQYIAKNSSKTFEIVSNPEFLKQGSAIDDFLYPERVIIGTNSKKAQEIMLEIYKPFNLNKNNILIMDENSAQMVKYAANSFLALKISFMNEIANLCEKTNANIEDIKRGLALDSRIGDKFLNAGIGYGGSCFPKDTKAIVNIAKNYKTDLKTIQSAIEVNENQIEKFIQKIVDFYKGNVKNKTFALLGIAFKPNTNDTREAPAIKIIQKLNSLGAKIKAYDPKAKYSNVEQVENIENALLGVDCLIIATEWEEFKNISIEQLQKLNDKAIFDGRNIFINRNLDRYGLKYFCIGKNEQQN